jgi:hypothetical protein
MMKDKITKFPITEYQRMRNMQGKLSVPCEVSERWLLFDPTSSKLSKGEFISLKVMTIGQDDKPKKICSLIMTKENLLKVLSKISIKE